MRFGIYTSVFGEFADPKRLGQLAKTAELAGWDGFFLWDHILFADNITLTDPWISLAAIACSTERILLGPLVTPLPRRRPWIVARQSVALDHLSGGRMVQGVGIGGDWWREFSAFGEIPDDKVHSSMLDEGIKVLTELWSGKPVTFHGHHYQIDDVCFLPKPIQVPRIPLWVAGYWPNKPAFQRAARWDGVFPYRNAGKITPADIIDIAAYIARLRDSRKGIDIILDTAMSVGTSESTISEYKAAGVTWWLECFDNRNSTREILERITQGPPLMTAKSRRKSAAPKRKVDKA